MTNITFPIINRRSMDQITKRITIEVSRL
uniref:Uncharacterized protein n=1 Tax=Anguilla anguilla TaxID=7936 RepID=A0A0E9V253_ANGAN